MDEEIERLIVAVRADTQGFARDVDTMRASLDGNFADGLDRAGRTLERSLLGAVRTGRMGFEDLRRVALNVLGDIAAAALRAGIAEIGGGGGGLLSGLGSLITGLLGAPGRATGGPVSPMRAYRVGERGPELFVPTSAGRVETMSSGRAAPQVRLTINVAGDAGAPRALERSSRQVARAVARALTRAED